MRLLLRNGCTLFYAFSLLMLISCGSGSEEDSSLKMEEAFIHYELGMDYYGIGEAEKAENEWKEAVNLDPNSEARHMLGQILFQKGDYEGAKKEWEYMLNFNQNDYMALNNLGNLYKEMKNEEKALEFYSRALELNPQNGLAHFNMGNIYMDKDELAQAKEQYLKALELDPALSVAIYQMGNILTTEKKYDEAISCFKKLVDGGTVRQDQGFDSKMAGLSSLGRLYLEQNKFIEAEKYFKQGIENYPTYVLMHVGLGNALEGSGKIKDAEKEYKLALEIDPGFPFTYNALGNLYAEQGKNLDEAEKLLTKGMELDPNLKSNFLDSLGWVLYKKGNLEEALLKVEGAISLTDPEAKSSLSAKHYHLGMIHGALGNKKKAVENFNKSIDLDPQGESGLKAKKIAG